MEAENGPRGSGPDPRVHAVPDPVIVTVPDPAVETDPDPAVETDLDRAHPGSDIDLAVLSASH